MDNIDAARLLIANGADISAYNKNGWQPLHNAAHAGSARITRLLIDNNADKNAVAINQKLTARQIAERSDNYDVVVVIVKNPPIKPPLTK